MPLAGIDLAVSPFRELLSLAFSRLTADALCTDQALLIGRNIHTMKPRYKVTVNLSAGKHIIYKCASQSVGVWDVSTLLFGGLETSSGI